MFTGLVEGFTEVLALNPSVEGLKLTLRKKDFLDDLKIGDSLAVNGVCLTVMEITDGALCVELVPETLRVTTLSNLTLGQSVNVERALLAQGRIGGHFVLGHVDTQTSIIDICTEGDAKVVKFLIQQNFLPYLVPKGQIAIDGMSLTIMGVHEDYFTISLIPHTQKITIAADYKIGTEVNLEFDILAKYVLNNSTFRFNRYSANKDGYELTEESLDSDVWVTRDRGRRQRRHEHGGDVTGQDPASNELYSSLLMLILPSRYSATIKFFFCGIHNRFRVHHIDEFFHAWVVCIILAYHNQIGVGRITAF